MTKLQFKPFDKTHLIQELTKALPDYIVQTGLGTIQVRTSSFTVTGNIQIKTNPKSGEVRTLTAMHLVVFYLIILFPLGIYVILKKDKQAALEKKVVKKLKEILPAA